MIAQKVCGIDLYNQSSTGDKAKSLTAAATDSDHIPCVTIALEGNGQRPSHFGDGYVVSDKSYTLNTTEVHGIAYAINHQGGNVEQITENQTGTLTASMNSIGNNKLSVAYGSGAKYIVRRLTPLECERLQGYPDGWTDIGEYTNSKGKRVTVSDSSRYKALGNSIALPPWRWVLKRICGCYERPATMASLFDGIGGFPLIWEELNGKGSCLWASEIEEFPIAVTERRINGNE